MERCYITQGAQPGTLWQPRVRGWGECERKVQERGDMGILMADSHCCMAETNITSYSCYSPIKSKFKNKINRDLKSNPHTIYNSEKTEILNIYKKVTWLLGFPGGSDGQEMACSAGDLGSIPESGRFPGVGNGYPLQYSCLENSMDRGVWWAIIYGITKSQMWLRANTHTHTHNFTILTDNQKFPFLALNSTPFLRNPTDLSSVSDAL